MKEEGITENIEIIEKNKAVNRNIYWELLIIMFGVLSVLSSLVSVYKIDISYKVYIFTIGLNIFLYYMLKSKYKNKLLVVSLIFLVVFILLNMKSVVAEGKTFYESIYSFIAYEELQPEQNMSTILLLYIMFISMIINIVIKHKRFIGIVLVFTFILLVIPICYGVFPNNVSLQCVISFCLSLLTLNIYKGIGEGRIRKFEKVFVVKWTSIKSAIIILIITIMQIMVITNIYKKEDYVRLPQLSELKTDIYDFINDMSVESFKEIFKSDVIGTGGISGGKLGQIDTLSYKNIVALEVTLPEIYEIEYYSEVDQYIIGFRGGEYKGDSWEEIDYDYDGDYINYNSTDLLKYTGKTFWEDIGIIFKYKYNIKNISAEDKYNYHFYNSNENNSEYFELDTFRAENNYLAFDKYINSNGVLYKEEVEEYIEKERKYREYVYNEYTKVPDNVLVDKKKQLQGKFDGNNYSECIELARSIVEYGTKYDLNPGKLPEGKDFVEYFIDENRKGYCSHFASAATLFLRCMGIPARYVEGYTIKEDDIRESVSYEMDSYEIIEAMDEMCVDYYEVEKEIEGEFIFNLNDKKFALTFYKLEGGKYDNSEISYEQISENSFVANEREYVVDFEANNNNKTVIDSNGNQSVPSYLLYISPVYTDDDYNSYEFLDNKSIKSSVMMTTVSIKDTNAHAWTEIYIDNYGWVPVEFTPEEDYDDTEFYEGEYFNSDIQYEKEEPKENIDEDIEANEVVTENIEESSQVNEEEVLIKGKNKEISLLNNIIYIVVFIIVIVVIFIIIVINRKNKLIKLCKEDQKQYILELYIRIIKILEIIENRKSDINSYVEYAIEIDKKYECFSDCKFSEITKSVLKAKYDKCEIGTKEFYIVENGYKKLLRQANKSSSLLKRLKIKYII